MTSLATAAVLAAAHATLVAAALLIARTCLPRTAAASRVLIGIVGITCVLAVTAMAYVPLHGVLPAQRAPEHAIAVARALQDSPPAPPVDAHPSAELPVAAHVAPPGTTETALSISHVWMARLADGLQQATQMVDTAPRGWGSWLLAAVAAGSAVSLLRLMAAARAVERLRRNSTLVEDAQIVASVDTLRGRCGYRRHIEVRETATLCGAAAFGFVQPVILLPKDWRAWSAVELSAALAHEVAHIRRADYRHRFLALCCAALHFYHPLVRFAVRGLAIDQEFAADRLARRLSNDSAAYARGLARLALRYHETHGRTRAWSNVSLMPGSSDFLARRLEMLRNKNRAIDTSERRSTRFVTYGAAMCVIGAALFSTLLRGAEAADAPVNSATAPTAARPAVETARRLSDTTTAATSVEVGEASDNTFAREPFDPALARFSDKGGMLIRVGDFLRHPEIQPHIDTMNKEARETLHEYIVDAANDFDLRDIEWIACDFMPMLKSPDTLQFGSGMMVIRTSRAADWQANVLKAVPGSLAKSHEGKPYVELPVLPGLGPMPLQMRALDERTIIYTLGARPDGEGNEGQAKALQRFFDDSPRPCPWIDAWHAVDGGMVTVVYDNSQIGWNNLSEEARKLPPFVAPLMEQTKYIAVGLDWTESDNRTGLRLRATCTEQGSVREVHLAAMTLLAASWPAMFIEAESPIDKYMPRIMQFFSSVKVSPSAPDVSPGFLGVSAATHWGHGELNEFLGQFWTSPNE